MQPKQIIFGDVFGLDHSLMEFCFRDSTFVCLNCEKTRYGLVTTVSVSRADSQVHSASPVADPNNWEEFYRSSMTKTATSGHVQHQRACIYCQIQNAVCEQYEEPPKLVVCSNCVFYGEFNIETKVFTDCGQHTNVITGAEADQCRESIKTTVMDQETKFSERLQLEPSQAVVL
jgi:hypothetical protein